MAGGCCRDLKELESELCQIKKQNKENGSRYSSEKKLQSIKQRKDVSAKMPEKKQIQLSNVFDSHIQAIKFE